MKANALLAQALVGFGLFSWGTARFHPINKAFHHAGQGYPRLQRSANAITRRQADADIVPVTAPRTNIFQDLSDEEAVAVTSFLHAQPSLNLTAVADAHTWDNYIDYIALLQPNKSDALPYLDGTSAKPPARYARATIRFQATDEPYLQEFMIGPLPVANGTTTIVPLNYIYNKGEGKQITPATDQGLIDALNYEIGANMSDVIHDLLNGTAIGAQNDTLYAYGTNPPLVEDGLVYYWMQYWRDSTVFDDSSLMPLGLYYKINVTGRNPDGWSVLGWYYNGIFYPTTEEFRDAWQAPGFEKLGVAYEGPYGSTDWSGEELPLDTTEPPMPIRPSSPRYRVDSDQKYVEWMDFTFFISFSRDVGITLYDVRFKGERIIYELGLQEAMAHYASSDPMMSGTSYLDTRWGFGAWAFELISGYDCPAYATFLNTSFYDSEITYTHPRSLCLFEFQKDYPIQRHTGAGYVSVTKNVVFVVRSVFTVANYDYQFSYEFYLDGSVRVVVRASGYVQAAYWAHNEDYGFTILDKVSGSMHDHVLNFKLDLDVNGTANSLMKTEFVPTSEVYPWSDGKPRNTMKLRKSFVANEDDAKIFWAPNSAATYSVVNKDAPNEWGEYRGWKIVPTVGSPIHSTILNSSNLANSVAWSTHHLYALRQHDAEPRSAHPYNCYDPQHPLVDFAKYFDSEPLDQQDLVLYFNLGMHHAPDTSDLPNTIFTTAESGIAIVPQSYLARDASRASRQQVRVNWHQGQTSVDRFGMEKEGQGCFDLAETDPKLEDYIGDVHVMKFPYAPGNWSFGGAYD